MSFELTVATRRDPVEALGEKHAAASESGLLTTIHLNGLLDDASLLAIWEKISELRTRDVESIVISIEDVRTEGPHCLEEFEANMMRSREAGLHVQASVRDANLHREMNRLPCARDWLLVPAGATPTAVRRAIHVDHP